MYAAVGVHILVHFQEAVVKGHEKRLGLEHGAGLVEVGHGGRMVLVVLSVGVAHEAGHGLDVAGGHLHEYADALGRLNLGELVGQGLLAYFLHTHVEGRHDVAAVFGGLVHHLDAAVAHLLEVIPAGLAGEDAVKGEFQSVAGGVLELADGADSQLAEGAFAHVYDNAVETAPEREQGQLAHLAVVHV